ncbi:MULTISPECIES: hypothetical protein [unclassified Nostoc]|uniref:hypothetical protein n=1 Tax=unclassified Nostoc TaxID=2593658 RepID=UPI0013D65DC9|nr:MULTISPECIES: hypothetical protein [unclassified Nostoc]MBE9000644.1 hypothetical protein [Nostoc sp. LEGE 12447]NEU79021.1 hypothetical protein [Nostoc sp. UIC 10630]
MSWYPTKSCKRYLLNSIAVSLAMLACSQTPTVAQFISTVEPTEIYQLATPQKLRIPPIAQSEISVIAKSESVTNPGDLLAPPQFNTLIVREFPNIWQMRVPVDQVNLLYATYEMKAENGKSNAVSSEQRSNSVVQVVLEPLPIIEISRDLNTNTALVQGGFRLKMDVSGTQVAGQYAGELAVIVDRR